MPAPPEIDKRVCDAGVKTTPQVSQSINPEPERGPGNTEKTSVRPCLEALAEDRIRELRISRDPDPGDYRRVLIGLAVGIRRQNRQYGEEKHENPDQGLLRRPVPTGKI